MWEEWYDEDVASDLISLLLFFSSFRHTFVFLKGSLKQNNERCI